MRWIAYWIDEVLMFAWEIICILEDGDDGHSGPGPPKEW